MSDSVTAKDVAQYAKVSVGTVSRVFNNHNNVSEDIRQRVLKVAADLGLQYFYISIQVSIYSDAKNQNSSSVPQMDIY